MGAIVSSQQVRIVKTLYPIVVDIGCQRLGGVLSQEFEKVLFEGMVEFHWDLGEFDQRYLNCEMLVEDRMNSTSRCSQ
jgi:hypothetical protein